MFQKVRKKIVQLRENNKILQTIERFLQSRWFIVALTVFICTTQTLGLDMVGFIGLALAFVYICIFSDNINPIVPIVCLAIYCVSTQNSPWAEASGEAIKSESGSTIYVNPAPLYYSTFFSVLLCIGIPLLLCSAVFRVVAFGECKKSLNKNSVFIGMVLLCLSFLLSGAFSNSWTWTDLLWSVIQTATFLGIYIFFTSCVDTETFTLDYIANVMLAGLVCMIWSVFIIAVQHMPTVGGLTSAWKGIMVFGWGEQNAVGAYIAMVLPACFYKMYTAKKHAWIWSVVLLLGILAEILTLCRAGLVATAVVVAAGLIVGIIYKKTRRYTLWVIGTYATIALVAMVVIWISGQAETLLEYFFKKASSETLDQLSSGRLTIWKRFIEHFWEDPIFGGGFLVDWEHWEHTVAVKSSGIFGFYSVLAHNLLFQTLGGSGVFGLVALAAHLYSVGRRTERNHSYLRTFLTLALVGFLIVCMLDNVFYMAQFTFMYLAIIVAIEADCKRIEKEKKDDEGKTNATV